MLLGAASGWCAGSRIGNAAQMVEQVPAIRVQSCDGIEGGGSAGDAEGVGDVDWSERVSFTISVRKSDALSEVARDQ